MRTSLDMSFTIFLHWFVALRIFFDYSYSCKKHLFGFIFQESVYERIKKSGGPNPFNLFVIAEMECMHRLLACVRETLLVNELV